MNRIRWWNLKMYCDVCKKDTKWKQYMYIWTIQAYCTKCDNEKITWTDTDRG